MITTLSDKINIRHVVNIQGRSYSFEETKPDAINRLTGESTTPIEIYVEDDLAVAIINKICSSLKASKYVKYLNLAQLQTHSLYLPVPLFVVTIYLVNFIFLMAINIPQKMKRKLLLIKFSPAQNHELMS